MKRTRIRDALTGRFGRRADAEAHPETTVVETVSDAPQVLANLRWRIQTLEAVMLEEAATLAGMAYDSDRCQVAAARLEQVARDRIPDEAV